MLKAIVFLGLSVLAPACGKDEDCSEARDMAQAIRSAAANDGIESDGICGLSDEEIRAVIDGSPYVPPGQKADRALQYQQACARYREAAENCDDLETDGDVG